VDEQETAYLAALGRVASYSSSPGSLILRDAAGTALLQFGPQPQAPLEGTSWQALSYNNGHGGVTSVIAGTTITAHFENGVVSGSSGCNSYSAGYSVSGPTIAIGPAASTRMACSQPAGVMEQEAAYLAALETARVYRIEGAQLILETASGARVANFAAQPVNSGGAAASATTAS
jgi:heat shock protein HslJ